jgi:nucleotide-binding universal stress UspA family protein
LALKHVDMMGGSAMTTGGQSVVVGIDGSEANKAALEWAAEEAYSLGLPLRLLHVVEGQLKRTRYLSESAIDAEVKSILERSQHEVEKHPAIQAHTEVEVGAPATELVKASRDASLLVLGRRGRGTFARLLLGSVSTAAATRSMVPSVVVPAGWDRAAHAKEPIVVGVEDTTGSEAALRYAFETAARTGARIHAVHAWDVASIYGWDTKSIVGDFRRWSMDASEIPAEAAAPWRERFPDVHVSYFPHHGHVVAGLLEEADEAQCLVVGGRRHRPVTGAMIGSSALGVLHHASCPVVVAHSHE